MYVNACIHTHKKINPHKKQRNQPLPAENKSHPSTHRVDGIHVGFCLH